MKLARSLILALLAATSAAGCGNDSNASEGADAAASTPDGSTAGTGGGTAAGGQPNATGGSSGAAGATSPGNGGATGTGGTPNPGLDSGTALGPYPEGPYGVEVGNVIANLALAGYVNDAGTALSNTLAFDSSYSLQDLRASGAPYALIHVSAVYCPGCRNAARDLGMLGESVLDAGGAVLELLSEDQARNTAARTDLDAWIETYDLRVSSFIDGPGSPEGARIALGVRETTVIVEMPGMHVVYLDHGDTSGRTASSIAPAVAETIRLLNLAP